MKKTAEFKWKHYEPKNIFLTVRLCLRYNLSFHDLVEIMEERDQNLMAMICETQETKKLIAATQQKKVVAIFYAKLYTGFCTNTGHS